MAGPTTPKERFQFVYNGVEYDATEYAEKHPGGLNFLQNMKKVTKDFTEYFRALHSDAALKILKSFPIISIGKPSTSSEQYMQIYKKVQKYNEPIWIMEILLFLLVASTWFVGCTTQYSWLSIICFSFSMILVGWIGHSAIHNRNPTLNKAAKFASTGFGGFSVDWWNNKHNMHHMFTNIVKYDQDIQHQYKIYLFEFLYLKWRFDSLVYAIKDKNLVDLGLLAFNYGTLVYWHENALYFLAAALLSGFYSAIILVGNHQNQKRFAENPNMPFMDHQICTSRNYKEENFFWLLLMGGMQFQAEHHLFPQIPFYRLPNAKIVIKNELAKLNKSLIYGPIR